MSETSIELDRRQFIKVSLIAGAGLVVTSYAPAPGRADAVEFRKGAGGGLIPNAWIRIAPDDTVTVMIKHTELGQGTSTGLCMIAAEELEADWSRMRFEFAPVAKVYKNPDIGVQATGGSTGVKTSWDPLRRAAAATREMLVAAAAEAWAVPPSSCRAENGTVIHEADGMRLRYGELLERAAAVRPPRAPRLKKAADFKIVGQPLPRLDGEDKARGRIRYGMDFTMPGLLTAAVVHAPMLGGRPASVDDGTARTMAGVRAVVTLESAVAVVGDTYWQARKAADSLKVEWKGGTPTLSNESVFRLFEEESGKRGVRLRNDGNVEEAMRKAERQIRAVYELPYQAHACPEPMNCAARVTPRACDVWAPTQSQEPARDLAARITGLPLRAVHVHTPFVGGGFGRRGMLDVIGEAIMVSRAVKAPVKVIWSREEDIRNDFFRPSTYNVVEAGLDKDGYPVAWIHKAVGQNEMDILVEMAGASILPEWLPSSVRHGVAALIVPFAKRFMGPEAAVSGSADMAYAIEHVRVEYVKVETPVPVGPWRSVGDGRNAFVKESFMDEIAVASRRDPVDLRMKLLGHAKKESNVLEMAATKAGWGGSSAGGIAQGVALHTYHGTPVAMVAEVSVEKGGAFRVHRVVCAVDCGTAVNPRTVTSQLVGALFFGLTAVKSSLRLRDGRVQQSNFNDFPVLRMDEVPRVEVHLVKSAAPPNSVGEVGVPPIAPAVTNALFRATGKRIRRLPVDRADLTA